MIPTNIIGIMSIEEILEKKCEKSELGSPRKPVLTQAEARKSGPEINYRNCDLMINLFSF